MENLTTEISSQVEAKLRSEKNGISKDIFTAIFKEGAVQREYRFYAPAEDKSIEDPEKRKRDRNKRIWLLCKRYERFLKSTENRKVSFVGIPQPFVRDIEAEMKDFENNLSPNQTIVA